MAESTLSVTRAEIRRRIGREFGIGPTPAATDAWTEVDEYIRTGERNFYHPPILPNERTAHRWSFMQQPVEIDLDEGEYQFTLPDLFGGFVDRLTFPAASAFYPNPLTQTTLEKINDLRSKTQTAGVPELFSVDPDGDNDGSTGQRFKLSVWPTPDADYTVSGLYHLNPFDLTDAIAYPLGGQPHAETLLMACMAAAELGYTGQRGSYYMQFLERLATSVSWDRSTGPKYFGRNDDPSIGCVGRERHTNYGDVTYNGL